MTLGECKRPFMQQKKIGLDQWLLSMSDHRNHLKILVQSPYYQTASVEILFQRSEVSFI